MTNHPNRSQVRYYKVCPRGFANEVTYIKVNADQVEAVEKHFEDYEDDRFNDGATRAYSCWTSDKAARMPGVALSWAQYLGEEA